MLNQGLEAEVTLNVGGKQQSPGSLQGNVIPFRGNPESWYGRHTIETLHGLLSRPLRPFSRDVEFRWREWFLSWKKKRGGEEIDWAPGCWAGSVVTDGNLEKGAGCISLSFNNFSVCPGPGTQPGLPGEVCVWNLSSRREGTTQRCDLAHWR